MFVQRSKHGWGVFVCFVFVHLSFLNPSIHTHCMMKRNLFIFTCEQVLSSQHLIIYSFLHITPCVPTSSLKLWVRQWAPLQPSLGHRSKRECLTKMIFHLLFSPRWIQPKRKGRPTPSSHPEVISACSSLPKLQSCFCCCCLKTACPSSCLSPSDIGGGKKGSWGGDTCVWDRDSCA